MSDKLLTIDVYQNKNVVYNFEWYAALSFVLTFLSTVVGFLILLRYVVYRLSKEKEKDKGKHESCNSNIKQKRDIDEISFDSEFSFSDDEDTIEVNNNLSDNSCNNVQTPVAENLHTNYVKSKNLKETDNRCLNNSLLLITKMITTSSSFEIDCVCLLESLLWPKDFYSNLSLDLNLVSLIDYNLKNIISLRKNLTCDIINFVLKFLSKECLISEETAMRFKAKNEQLMEESHCKNLENFLMSSEILDLIIKSLVPEIEENLYAIEKLPGFQKIAHNSFMINIKCLKLLSSFLSDLSEISTFIAISNIKKRINIKNQFNCIKFRFAAIKKIIFEILTPSDYEVAVKLYAEHKDRVQKHLIDSEFIFLNKVQSTTHLLHAEHQLIYNQLLNSQAEHKNNLTQEVMSSKFKTIDELVMAYEESLFVMHNAHYTQFLDLLTNCCSQESEKINNQLNSFFDKLMQNVFESEEIFFNCLQKVNKHTDDNVLSMLNSVQKEYKDLKVLNNTKCNKLLSHLEENFRNDLQELVGFINDTIKSVSYHYKVFLNSTSMIIASLPCFSESQVETLSMEFKERVSVIAFNLVCGLLGYFMDVIWICDDNSPSVIIDLANDIDGIDNFFDKTNLKKYLDFISEISYKEIKEKQNKIIQMVFSNESSLFIKSILLESKHSVKKLYEIQCNVFCTANNLVNSFQVDNKEIPKPYLSRKGLSHVEKSCLEELKDIYYRLLRMKKTKVEELNKSLEEVLLKYSIPENKNCFVSCINTIQKPVSFTNQDLEQHLKSKFYLEQHYTIDRLLKKLNELKQKHPGNINSNPNPIKAAHLENNTSNLLNRTSSNLVKKLPVKTSKVNTSYNSKKNFSNKNKSSVKIKNLNK